MVAASLILAFLVYKVYKHTLKLTKALVLIVHLPLSVEEKQMSLVNVVVITSAGVSVRSSGAFLLSFLFLRCCSLVNSN